MRRQFLAAAAMLLAAGAHADEVVVQNDSFAAGGGFNVCPCFAPGEEAAVWLTAPCDGNIVAIQVFWQSFFGGSDPSIEDSIVIYQGGTHPTPGPFIDELLAPVLTDGFLNEYRHYDENMLVPISIPVSAGETFVVSLKFFNDNQNDFFAGTIGSDDDGCTPGRNAVKVGGVSWNDACALGVSGDWVIRAVIDCQGDETGACCTAEGGCDDGVTQSDCETAGGLWNGLGSLCSDAEVTCEGACLVPNGNCVQFDFATCDLVSGVWQGPGTLDCDDCPADIDGDGDADPDDINAFVNAFTDAVPDNADVDGDGDEDPDDISAFVNAFVAGC